MSAPFASTHGALQPVDPDKQASDSLALQRRTEKLNAPRLVKFLLKTLDAIAALDANDNLKIHNEMVTNVAYFDGRFDGKIRNGVWVDNPKIDGEIIPQDNDLKRHVDKLLMEMSRTALRYDITPIDQSDPAKREAAAFARKRIEVNQSRIETDPFLQRENMSLLLKTWALRYTWFDPQANSPERTIETQAVKGLINAQSVTVCRTCGMSVTQTPCRQCGDSEVRQLGTEAGESTEYKQHAKPSGRAVSVQPDATMVQLDLNARDIPSSSFLRWRLTMRRCDWEAMFPNSIIPSSGQSDEARWKAQAENYVSNSDGYGGSSDDSTGGGDQFEKIEGELVWLDPKVYQRYASREREQIGDHVLEANETLTPKYPDGCCVARIAQTILDLFPSNKNTCWTMAVYGIRGHALHGSGITSLRGPQDTINDENAFIVGHHYQFASGREFMRSGALEGGRLPNINEVGIVNCSDESVQDVTRWAYGRTQPQALSGDVYAFREAMRGAMQDAAGTSSLSNAGAADMKALGTATGVEAARDQAVGRIIPNRKLQAYMGCEWLRQVLTLERENYTAETFLGLADKPTERGVVEFTERGVRTFFQCDLDEFLIKPVEGSWVPTSPAQIKANAVEFANISAQLRGADGGPDKELLSTLAPALNVDYNVDEWGADQRAASMRLQEYARVAKVIDEGGYGGNPEMVAVVLTNCAKWAQVNPILDRHPAFRDFYQDWHVSDEGRNASDLLSAVIEAVYALHGEGMVSQQQVAGQAEIDAAAPQVKQQQEQQAAMAESSQQSKVQDALGQQLLTERDRLHEAQVTLATQPPQSQADQPAN